MTKYLTFLILILYSSLALSADSKTHLLILGGAGDPKPSETNTDPKFQKTIFDYGLMDTGRYYQAKKQSGSLGVAAIAFDGGHPETQAIKTQFFPQINSKQDFTVDTLNEQIESYKQMLLNNTIKSGDQLMIQINTHGAQKLPKEKNKTHQVSIGAGTVTELNSGKGSKTVSLDILEDLKNIARQKGVRLAIIDLSCHSGSTQKLSDENTCVISATGPNQYAFTGPGFMGRFTKNLKIGDNLESVFLKSRNTSTEIEYPMISTPEGNLISEKIYQALSPYLGYKQDDEEDKLTLNLIDSASDPQKYCEQEQAFANLIKFLDQIDKTKNDNKKVFSKQKIEPASDFNELKKALIEYKALQDQMIKTLKDTHRVDLLKNKSTILSFVEYSWDDLIHSDWDDWISSTKSELQNTPNISPSEKESLQFQIKFYNAAREQKIKILNENPGLRSYTNIVDTFDDARFKTTQLASKIASIEKKIYNTMYKQYSSENITTNPCREFKL